MGFGEILLSIMLAIVSGLIIFVLKDHKSQAREQRAHDEKAREEFQRRMDKHVHDLRETTGEVTTALAIIRTVMVMSAPEEVRDRMLKALTPEKK